MIEDGTNEEQWLYGENPEQVQKSSESVPTIVNGVTDVVPNENSSAQDEDNQLQTVPIEEDLRPPGVDEDLALVNADPYNQLWDIEPNLEMNELDSDADDDLDIVIGDIKTNPAFEGLNIRRGQIPTITTVDKLKQPAGKFTVEEFETAGMINGVPIADYSLEAAEDKPWRKPGADISDYFNYGFNEDTWNAYCERQKRIRAQVGVGPNIGLPILNSIGPRGLCGTNEHSKYTGTLLTPVTGGVRKIIPPPSIRRPPGAIDVIGGTTMASRRSDNLTPAPPGDLNLIEVMTAEKRNFNNMPPPIIPGAFPNFDDEYFNPEPTPYYDGFEPTQEVQWKPGQEPNWIPEVKEINHGAKIPVLTTSSLVSLQQANGRAMPRRYDDVALTIKREPHHYRSRSRTRSPYRESDRGREKSDRHKDKHKRDRSRSRNRRHRSRSRSVSRHRSSHKKKRSRHHDKDDSE